MKVADFMQKNPIFMHEDQPVRDAARFLFNLGISGVLVCKGKKLTGIITEIDILQRLFPSIKDFMEDQLHALDADGFMEDKFSGIINRPVSEYMTKQVKTVQKNTPVMRALSLMLVNEFTHVPVVNKNGELEGIISQGDIFKAIVGSEIPYDDEIEYFDWLAYHFDYIQQTRDRYRREVAELTKVYQKHGVKNILDIGCGTGGHAIELAKLRYKVIGLNRSPRMTKYAEKKIQQTEVQRFVRFIRADKYETYINSAGETYEAVMLMGNALSHIGRSYKVTLEAAMKHLASKSVVVIQLANFYKILHVTKRFQDFNIAKSAETPGQEYAYLEFYDPPREDKDMLTLVAAIHIYNGKRWAASHINSTPVVHITEQIVRKILDKNGFRNIKVYGSEFGEPLFEEKFDKEKHDWVNIVATR
ncbi:MAG TPA: CBS domain-containing protein [Patescibacteria group bacterium]|nr:CBS domain-containing protein [Patescibacteria group bacterium]